MDRLTQRQRSSLMSRIRSVNTLPELVVRRALHAAGFRYRLHVRELPGTPDLVFPSRHIALFVHGCFWHGHGCRLGRRQSKSNVEFWEKKIATNRKRDIAVRRRLRLLGWNVRVVWQCRLRDDLWLRRTIELLVSANRGSVALRGRRKR